MMTPTTAPRARKTAARVPVYLSAGSNIQPARHLRMACNHLEQRYGALQVSSVYRNPAVGFEGEDFLNIVIGMETEESPESINEFIEYLHDEAGRVRGSDPFSPRELDIDLLLYGDLIARRGKLKLPRADVERYGFVLGPMAELAPDLEHPVSGSTMSELWDSFDQDAAELTRLPMSII